MILKQLERPHGGRAWYAESGKIVPTQPSNYSILVLYVKDYFKFKVLNGLRTGRRSFDCAQDDYPCRTVIS